MRKINVIIKQWCKETNVRNKKVVSWSTFLYIITANCQKEHLSLKYYKLILVLVREKPNILKSHFYSTFNIKQGISLNSKWYWRLDLTIYKNLLPIFTWYLFIYLSRYLDHAAVQIINHVNPKSRFWENRETQSQCLHA